jgi:hypothetical protein
VNPNTGLLTPEDTPALESPGVQEGSLLGQRMSPREQESRVPRRSNFEIVLPRYEPMYTKYPATSGYLKREDDNVETTLLERQESGRSGNTDSASDDTRSRAEEPITEIPTAKRKYRVFQKSRESNRQRGRDPGDEGADNRAGKGGQSTGVYAVQDIVSREMDQELSSFLSTFWLS